MQIYYKKLSQIHLNPSNPRVIKDDKFKKLCKSIQEFPKMLELRPIIIDDLGEILAGNQRYRACKELKIKEVPVLLASDLSPEEKQEFIVKDNLSAGEWDFDMLSAHFDSDILEEWGMDIFNISADEDQNKEIEVESLSDEMVMTFKLSSIDYQRINQVLLKHGETKEIGLINLINKHA